MTESRKHFSADAKMTMLRRHLLDRVPVSDLCDEYGINPTVFYRWQKQLFEGGAALFEPRPQNQAGACTRKVTALEEKLARKNEVISELLEELVRLKKTNADA
jgi:transposase-like protein